MKKIWKTPAILTNAILLVLIALCSIVFIVTKPEVQPENVFLLMMYALSSAMLWFSALALISLLISNFTSIQLSYVTKIVFRVLAGIVFGLMVFSPVSKDGKDEDLLADGSSHPKTSQKTSSKANESSLPGNYHETLSKDADTNKDK